MHTHSISIEHVLYLIWRPVASILPAPPHPPPPNQLSSSLLPPSPPHPTSLCAHRRVCIFISRLSHTDTNLKRRESKSCIITASVCALHCISTVCTLTDVRRRDCGTLFFYFLFKLFKVFSEKISVWYCETEETTESCTEPVSHSPETGSSVSTSANSVYARKRDTGKDFSRKSLWCFPMKTEELQ